MRSESKGWRIEDPKTGKVLQSLRARVEELEADLAAALELADIVKPLREMKESRDTMMEMLGLNGRLLSRVAAAEARAERLREALGRAAKAAADEVRENYGGETIAAAVFHAVKTVARAALAREGEE